MEIPALPFEISATSIVMLLVLFVIVGGMRGRVKKDHDDPFGANRKRGPDMAYSAGRDAAAQNSRSQQVFIPMESENEALLRAFYLDEMGLMEMRAPNYPKDTDGFWAVSGSRQIYFGTQPSFDFAKGAMPGFPIKNLPDVAERLHMAGYQVAWDTSTPYVQCLVVVDPAGTQIALIAG